MQNKKGLYLLLAFIGTILVFFCVLFFVHERTLENGILFTVSFNYPNAQNITYNFYNQSGKIEKVEIGDDYKNSLFLDKTEYKSVKLLRKVLKGLKEKKEIPTEEGITIYNGQNKRYYLLPFDKEIAKELSDLIIDGYIHSELSKFTNNIIQKEIYLYEDKNQLKWTDNGAKPRIIHTYQCTNDVCNGLYSDNENNEKVLYDGEELFLYNYVTKSKEKINITDKITKVQFIKQNNQLMGLELTNSENKNAYYDINQKKLLTSFKNSHYSAINENLFLEITKENSSEILLQVWNEENKVLWKNSLIEENGATYQIKELKNEAATYYLLEKILNDTSTFQILNEEWKPWLEFKSFTSVELKENGNLTVGQGIENQITYEEYDGKGLLIPKEED